MIDGGVQYVADFINDDQPYVMDVGGRKICSIPYSSEINDLPQFMRMGRTAEEFAEMIRRQFDTLYRESVDSRSGRVMAICLHPFVIGVPHRIGRWTTPSNISAGMMASGKRPAARSSSTT